MRYYSSSNNSPNNDNNDYEFRSELVLEQYYLLDPSFNCGNLKLDSRSSNVKRSLEKDKDSSLLPLVGTAASCPYLYMYNRDKTILYHYTRNRGDFIHGLNIHYATFEKHLEKGTYYLGKYLFTSEFAQLAKFKNMSIPELSLILAKDRERFKRKKD